MLHDPTVYINKHDIDHSFFFLNPKDGHWAKQKGMVAKEEAIMLVVAKEFRHMLSCLAK